mmetsp:Transcript_30515/g.66518  ORF Transcript_30515/g.66518 Transcript_30515/m.66518 type:complete len:114 (-) Transcript_30515:307-648(-)
MGANTVNRSCEAISKYIISKYDVRVDLKILSNFCTERLFMAEFHAPLESLKYKEYSGREIAENILECYKIACKDVYRATTHNKGIMNGVDAVLIACGNDFRAVESGCHAYASW